MHEDGSKDVRMFRIVMLCVVLACWVVTSQGRNIPLIVSSGEDITTGLVLHAPLQGNLNEISGEGHTLVWAGGTGSPSYVSAFGGQQAIDFGNGQTDERITVAAATSINNLADYTIAFCVRPRSDGGGNFGRVLDVVNTAGTTAAMIAFFFQQTATEFEVQESRYSGGVGRWQTSGSPLAPNTDFHIAVRFDVDVGTTPDIFVNSVLQTKTQIAPPSGTPLTSTTGTWWFGNRDDIIRTLDGFLAHMRVYDILKTDAEIAAMQAADCP